MAESFTRQDRDQLYALLEKLSETVSELPGSLPDDARNPDLAIAAFIAEYRFRILPRLFPGDDPDADEDYARSVSGRN
jgi:hypothetical protein